MHRALGWMALAGLLVVASGCARKVPPVDLSRLEPSFLERCTNEVGVLIVLEERYLDYFNRAYDNSAYWELGGDKTPVKRQVLRILSAEGARRAEQVSVIHYRERTPVIDVHAWMQDGTPRPVNVHEVETTLLADWPCELHAPRRTDFRIASLAAGDTVEIRTPISGPDRIFWTFGSEQHCLLHSRAMFGHPQDEYRPDFHATVIDASGAVRRTSEGDAYPMVFELRKPLMPITRDRLPFVLMAIRCPGWSNLRGQLFRLPLWMARAGSIAGRKAVNPFLMTSVEDDQRARRIRAVGEWVTRWIHLEEPGPFFWMRWMPVEPAHKTARRRRGSPGSVAALIYRILEDAGLAPRFALVHTHPLNPFDVSLPTTSQFDTLAILVDDENHKTHWLVPGIRYDPADQPPASIRGRHALVLQRWWLDREQGAGDCNPVNAVGFSCQHMTPEPVEVELVTVGTGAELPSRRDSTLR